MTETKHFRILNKIFCRFDPNHLIALHAILEAADPSTPERVSLTELAERSHRKIHELLQIKEYADKITLEVDELRIDQIRLQSQGHYPHLVALETENQKLQAEIDALLSMKKKFEPITSEDRRSLVKLEV